MTIHFTAEAVEIEETEFSILSVGFYTDENYLMIQQSLDFADANYHIERDDQSFGGYGGVERIKLSREQIEVGLNETGKENLQCDGVTIDFATDDATYQLLLEKLKLIFENSLTFND